ncbi:hypothetical protein [Nocardioides sp.]|uniref:WXG100 family type VII secretion target n=1 Tax=Nocardioides sp. TaxID=35761 RepID=UPI002ED33DE5
MSNISLEFQELQDAARAVAAGLEPLNTVLTDLGGAIETAAVGFKGQAATGLGEALAAWFDVATTLGPILEGYAQAIMTVANEHVLNEGEQTRTYSGLVDRLGGSHD